MTTDKVKIVKSPFPKNDKEYEYAVCSCFTSITEGIQIPRPELTSFVEFKCPRCGKNLGMFISGKKSFIDFSKKL